MALEEDLMTYMTSIWCEKIMKKQLNKEMAGKICNVYEEKRDKYEGEEEKLWREEEGGSISSILSRNHENMTHVICAQASLASDMAESDRKA